MEEVLLYHTVQSSNSIKDLQRDNSFLCFHHTYIFLHYNITAIDSLKLFLSNFLSLKMLLFISRIVITKVKVWFSSLVTNKKQQGNFIKVDLNMIAWNVFLNLFAHHSTFVSNYVQVYIFCANEYIYIIYI